MENNHADPFQVCAVQIDQIQDPVNLLRLHNSIMDQLRKMGCLRTSNTPTGDYAEYIAANCLGLRLEGNSKKGFDATDKHGNKYQIKSRHLTKMNPSLELGAVSNVAENAFDYLIVLIFDYDWNIHAAAKLTHEAFSKHSKPTKKGHVLLWNDSMLNENGVSSLKDIFN